MGDLSKNFSRSEFECKCGCGTDTVDYALINTLQSMAYTLGLKYKSISIVITSGIRCTDYNETIQLQYDPHYIPYTSKSQHKNCKAADFKVYYKNRDNDRIQLDPVIVDEYLKENYPDTYGIGLYNNRNHLDVRKKKARWNKS